MMAATSSWARPDNDPKPVQVDQTGTKYHNVAPPVGIRAEDGVMGGGGDYIRPVVGGSVSLDPSKVLLCACSCHPFIHSRACTHTHAHTATHTYINAFMYAFTLARTRTQCICSASTHRRRRKRRKSGFIRNVVIDRSSVSSGRSTQGLVRWLLAVLQAHQPRANQVVN